MSIEGYRGVKDYRYTELKSGAGDFGIRDQKGRAIGYRWRIYRVNVELLSDEEYRSKGFCGIIKDGKPLEYIEARTTTTRDGEAYGPITSRVVTETFEQAWEVVAKRAAAARKNNAKKFAAFNRGAA